MESHLGIPSSPSQPCLWPEGSHFEWEDRATLQVPTEHQSHGRQPACQLTGPGLRNRFPKAYLSSLRWPLSLNQRILLLSRKQPAQKAGARVKLIPGSGDIGHAGFCGLGHQRGPFLI